MTDRRETFLSIRDVLEHLGRCYDDWQAADPRTERYLAESIQRDLDQVRRLSESLRRDAIRRHDAPPRPVRQASAPV